MSLSVVPALFIVWHVWETDPFGKPPAILVLVTFLLCCILVSVPLAVNTATVWYFRSIPFGMALFFLFVVAPVEETTKWLAVRLYGYNHRLFDSAVNGAVLGAVAGLAFTTMENALYISGAGLLGTGGTEEVTIARAAIGPLHVMWSAIAGYYLGLGKLNRKSAGPLFFKGLLVASLLHGTYNTVVTYLPDVADAVAIPALGTANTQTLMLTVFLLGFYGVVGYYPLRKLNRYRRFDVDRHSLNDVRDVIEMSDDEVDEFLTSHGIGVLSLSEENSSYSVPISYGYDPEERFLCMMLGYAPRSEKRRWVNNTETASFVVHEMRESLESESVIVRGELKELSDDELRQGYEALSNNALFTVLHLSGAFAEDTDFVMYRMEIDSIGGRRFEHDIGEQIEESSVKEIPEERTGNAETRDGS